MNIKLALQLSRNILLENFNHNLSNNKSNQLELYIFSVFWLNSMIYSQQCPHLADPPTESTCISACGFSISSNCACLLADLYLLRELRYLYKYSFSSRLWQKITFIQCKLFHFEISLSLATERYSEILCLSLRKGILQLLFLMRHVEQIDNLSNV